MKHQWLAYVIVGLLSIGAGVAIAGLPDNAPVDATITSPTPTAAAETSAPETETTVAPTSAPETQAPDTTEPTMTVPDTTETTTTRPATTVSETTSPATTDAARAGLPDRSELNVVSANGANVAGAALRVATRLEEAGYVDVQLRNGTGIVEFTTVYFAAGFEEAGLRLAEDLDLLPFYVAPIEVVPTVIQLPDDVDLVAYIGLDRA